jgi:hypothetical protein
MVNAETLTALLTETCFMFLTHPDRLSVRMVSASHPFFSIAGSRFTPLESHSIPACPAISNGVYYLTFPFRPVPDGVPFQPWFWVGYL